MCLAPDRLAAIERAYASLQPMVQYLAKPQFIGCTLLDVGSGEGVVALKMAEDFRANRVILVDHMWEPAVELPPHAEFHLADVHTEEFVGKFQNKANVVVSKNAFHEFGSPPAAAMNIIRVVPIGGIVIILDYTSFGWEQQMEFAMVGDDLCKRHFCEDVQRLKRTGLGSDEIIRWFWEEEVSPMVPGECLFNFHGGVYSFVYLPRQWGEVKEPPPEVKRALEAMHRGGRDV